MKLKEYILQFVRVIWKDQVGSAVIAGIILFIITAIYSAIKSFLTDTPFIEIFKTTFFYPVPLYIVLIIITLQFCIHLLFNMIRKSRQNRKITVQPVDTNAEVKKKAMVGEYVLDDLIYNLRLHEFNAYGDNSAKTNAFDVFMWTYESLTLGISDTKETPAKVIFLKCIPLFTSVGLVRRKSGIISKYYPTTLGVEFYTKVQHKIKIAGPISKP